MAVMTGYVVGSPVGDTDRGTVQLMRLGTVVSDKDGNDYTYVKAGAAIAQYDVVRFNGSTLGYDDVRPIAAANQLAIGVATAAFNVSEYGLVLTRGVTTAKVVTSTAAGSILAAVATAGTLGLAVVGELQGKPAVALVTGVSTGSAIAIGI